MSSSSTVAGRRGLLPGELEDDAFLLRLGVDGGVLWLFSACSFSICSWICTGVKRFAPASTKNDAAQDNVWLASKQGLKPNEAAATHDVASGKASMKAFKRCFSFSRQSTCILASRWVALYQRRAAGESLESLDRSGRDQLYLIMYAHSRTRRTRPTCGVHAEVVSHCGGPSVHEVDCLRSP
jgi:hypothetical protein